MARRCLNNLRNICLLCKDSGFEPCFSLLYTKQKSKARCLVRDGEPRARGSLGQLSRGSLARTCLTFLLQRARGRQGMAARASLESQIPPADVAGLRPSQERKFSDSVAATKPGRAQCQWALSHCLQWGSQARAGLPCQDETGCKSGTGSVSPWPSRAMIAMKLNLGDF